MFRKKTNYDFSNVFRFEQPWHQRRVTQKVEIDFCSFVCFAPLLNGFIGCVTLVQTYLADGLRVRVQVDGVVVSLQTVVPPLFDIKTHRNNVKI